MSTHEHLQGRIIRNTGFVALSAILLVLLVLAFMTYTTEPGANAFTAYAVLHHSEIMAGLVVIAVVFGFALAQRSYAAIERERAGSRDILGIVLLFLSAEEKAIVNLLVEQGGSTNQAEIARLPGMNRVKAHRSLQKMQEKRIIELVPHGKIRKVHLKENLRTILAESGKLKKQG